MNYKTSHFKSCYESHPPLDIAGFKIYGGSCITPVVKDADIYVGFDRGMAETPAGYPWESTIAFLYHIPDGQPPRDAESFKKMIDWLQVQLLSGKKIHMGCIGGHGRTGLVLAALVKQVTGEEDAITHVRDNYCKKVVESASQVTFLNTHYGIKKVEGSKEFRYTQPPVAAGSNSEFWEQTRNKIVQGRQEPPKKVLKKTPGTPIEQRDALPSSKLIAVPTAHLMSVWGANVLFDNPGKPATI